MIKVLQISQKFGYIPQIKFIGPRSKLHQTQKASQPSHLIQSPSYVHTGQPSIFLSSLRFPQLTEEEIEIINMGGARDPPQTKTTKGNKNK